MSQMADVTRVLRSLKDGLPGVEASALVSNDGLMIASTISAEVDAARVASMSAMLQGIGTRTAGELHRGEVDQVIISGRAGYAVLRSASPGTVLLVLAEPLRKTRAALSRYANRRRLDPGKAGH